MDLNYLLSRHQRSLMLMENAPSPEVRHAHRGLASGYATSIRDLQHRLGATMAPLTVDYL